MEGSGKSGMGCRAGNETGEQHSTEQKIKGRFQEDGTTEYLIFSQQFGQAPVQVYSSTYLSPVSPTSDA